ncbi:MAG TPA: tetratricopeptide repeat protein [Chloroflexi bacterium]|nr:tetratricopeptide repeat protein [Chloroflexota bacterium]
MTNSHIVHVNDTNFQYEVISFSQNTPVVVDFWAPWSRDCRILSPLLEKLIGKEFRQFRLAKINADENPNTTLMYSVHSLPTVKAFANARVVDQFVGMVPEMRIRQMLINLTQAETNSLTLEKANNLLDDNKPEAAEKAYREYLHTNPQSSEAFLGLIKSLLRQNNYLEPYGMLGISPITKISTEAQQFRTFADLMTKYTEDNLPGNSELDVIFRASLRLITLGNFPAALDGMLDIMRKDKDYRDGKAKIVFLATLDLIGANTPMTKKYRQELSSILF